MSYEPEPNSPIADETLDLNLPESLEIVQLLTLVGDYHASGLYVRPDQGHGGGDIEASRADKGKRAVSACGVGFEIQRFRDDPQGQLGDDSSDG